MEAHLVHASENALYPVNAVNSDCGRGGGREVDMGMMGEDWLLTFLNKKSVKYPGLSLNPDIAEQYSTYIHRNKYQKKSLQKLKYFPVRSRGYSSMEANTFKI